MLHGLGVTQIKKDFFLMNDNIFIDHLLRTDERLGKLDWPNLQEIEFPSVETDDCLLVCAGFENRAVETLRRACNAGITSFSLGIVNYLPDYQENKIHELRTIGQGAALRVNEFTYDRKNPTGIGQKLKQFTQDFEHVFIDISGMSRLLIVQTLVALIGQQHQQIQQISIIYGEAQEYPPFELEFKLEFEQNHGKAKPILSYLSSGIFEIAATPELGSVSMLGEAIRLVAFPSFDSSQFTNLIQELQPTYTELIHGIPPNQENKWRTEAIRKLNHQALDELQEKEDHEASTLDYRETLWKLLQIYAERSMFDRLVISPTGSKMQAVAVGLFRAALHDVQIVYPTPQVFTTPEKYTVGLRQLYMVDLPTEAIRICQDRQI